MTPEDVGALPEVAALRPVGLPYLDLLSEHSGLRVWHIDVAFDEWPIPDELRARWTDSEFDARDTWRKRPLARGVDSCCDYSCGEVELVARLRNAGFPAFWISEWSGFAHVRMWELFCVKRSEFRERAPDLWAFDQELRSLGSSTEALGRSGGHPDVACITPRGNVCMEYKGPGDKIKPKQHSWATAVLNRGGVPVGYLAVRGVFRQELSAQVAIPNRTELEAESSNSRRSVPVEQLTTPTATTAKQEPKAPKQTKLPKLHRRTISDTLKKTRGWSVISRTEGWIDFWPPHSNAIDDFAKEVRRAVEAMGYAPTVRIGRDSTGRSIVRVSTPETLDQAPRGTHGYGR